VLGSNIRGCYAQAFLPARNMSASENSYSLFHCCSRLAEPGDFSHPSDPLHPALQMEVTQRAYTVHARSARRRSKPERP